jgi:hypothetical protein
MKRSEWLLVAALFLAPLLGVAITAGSYGLTYDEQHYISAGVGYAKWYGRLLVGDYGELRPEAIAHTWRLNHEHPPLEKISAGASYFAFQRLLPGLASYRVPSALWFALTICALYLLTRGIWGRRGALFAALAFATMPRVFAHAHLAALDMPVTAWFFITAALTAEALRRESCALAALSGVAFGLALLSKVNAFFIPILLIPWGLIWYRRQWQRMLLPLLVIGPAVLYICWPWMWSDTLPRLREYLAFHFGHAAYNVWYLGKLYQYAPWHYPFVVTAVTTPLLLLLLALAGLSRCWPFWTPTGRVRAPEGPRRRVEPERALLFLGLLVTIVPSALPGSPKYNGERLFLPAFPFLAALAGGGFAWLQLQVVKLLGRTKPLETATSALVAVLLGAALLLPGVRALTSLHPYQLAYYNRLVGGTPGAGKHGFETIYWGQVFQEAPTVLNQAPEPSALVLVVPEGCISLLTMQQQAGLLNPEVRFTGDEQKAADVDYVIFQAMQSDYTDLCWELVQNETVKWVFPVENTPLLLVYRRPAVVEALARLASKEAKPKPVITESASKDRNRPTR